MRLLLNIILFLILILCTQAVPVQAQTGYCAASGFCSQSGGLTSCDGGPFSGRDCTDSDDCGGYDCRSYPWCANTGSAPSCGSYPSCGGGCPAGTCDYGSCTAVTTYVPPAPTPWPTPRPTAWPTPMPSPGCELTNTCPTPAPDPDPPPPPPPLSDYACINGACQAVAPGTGTDIMACIGGCSTGPVLISTSSCPQVQEMATEIIIMPGQTKSWYTWAQPEGNTPGQRLANQSPQQQVLQSFTSPGDKITIAYMWLEMESQPHSFYIYDSTDDTYFFFQGRDKPPVIFSRKQAVVDNAVKLGYKHITDVQDTQASEDAAEAYEKRVYKLSDNTGGDENHPWKYNNGPAFVRHAPIAESYDLIPYVNCASIFDSDSHSNYYSTNISNLDDDKYYCMRRQILRWGGRDEDGNELGVSDHIAGNYVGLEQDSGTYFGIDNSGDRIWALERILVGPRWDYFDNFFYAFMEPKNKFLQRPGTQNTEFTPGFLRMPIIQIPIEAFATEGEHKLYAVMHQGNISNDSIPVEDENNDNSCILNQDFNAEEFIYVKPYRTEAACSDFRVLDSNGQEATTLRIGQQYTISTSARLENEVYDFYNGNFSTHYQATDTTPAAVPNWTNPDGNVSFWSVRCDIDGLTCPPESDDQRSLLVETRSGADAQTSVVESDYIETNTSVTKKSFTVQFYARSTTGTRTISSINIRRDPYNDTVAPYEPQPVGADTQTLKFDGQSSITLTPTWKLYTGTVVFPDTHPYNSETSRIKLILRGTSGGIAVMYDNFTINGGHKPSVGFNMVPAYTPAQESRPDNQCSRSIPVPRIGDPYDSYEENRIIYDSVSGVSTGTLYVDPLIQPGDSYNSQPLTADKYYVFARLEEPGGTVHFGNPNAVVNCGVTDPKWKDDIADTCMVELPMQNCSEVVPTAPTFAQPSGYTESSYRASNHASLVGVPLSGGAISEMTLITSGGKYVLPIRVRVDANSTGITYSIYKMDASGNPSGTPVTGDITGAAGQTDYSFTIDPTHAALQTNQVYLRVFAKNGNSCASLNGITSPATEARLILIGQPTGQVLEVDRNFVSGVQCTEPSTHSSLTAIPFGTVPMSLNVTTSGSVPTSNGGHSYTSLTAEPHTDLPSGLSYIRLSLPYYPASTTWTNKVSSITLGINNTTSEEDSYKCADCNRIDDYSCYAKSVTNNTFASTESFQQTNFYLIKGKFYDSWWQVRGGLAFAGSNITNSIRSPLPLWLNGTVWEKSGLCSQDLCQPFVAAKAKSEANTNADISAGIAITNGSIYGDRGTSGFLSQNLENYQASELPSGLEPAPDHAAVVHNYDYYRELVDWGQVPSNNTIAVTDNSDTARTKIANASPYSPSNDNVYVMRVSGSYTLNLDQPIDVGANKKYIIFVEGNLIITSGGGAANRTKLIKVDANEFLMFIASGNITFASDLGYNNFLTTPIVEGVYFANQNLIIESKNTGGSLLGDLKFVGAGSFIGLNGVQLNRQFEVDGDIDSIEKNAQSPIEQFQFRPDFVTNAPDVLRLPNLEWEETD